MNIDSSKHYVCKFIGMDSLSRIQFSDRANNFYTCLGIWLLQFLEIFKNTDTANKIRSKFCTAGFGITSRETIETLETIQPDIIFKKHYQKECWECINYLMTTQNHDPLLTFLYNNPDMLQAINLATKRIVSFISKDKRFHNLKEKNLPDVRLFEHYEVIREVCNYFQIHLLVLSESDYNYVLDDLNTELPLAIIYREQDYSKDFTHEIYSLLYHEKIFYFHSSCATLDPALPFLHTYNISSTERVIDTLCMVNFKKVQEMSVLFSVFSHLNKLLKKDPLLFAAYMNLKKQLGLEYSEICYVCERILQNSDFSIVCMSHEHVKICNRHFEGPECFHGMRPEGPPCTECVRLEGPLCPHCFRELSESEIEKLYIKCSNCNNFYNKQERNCRNSECDMCRKCLFYTNCENCGKGTTASCKHSELGKIARSCIDEECFICEQCLGMIHCRKCRTKVEVCCLECGMGILEGFSVYPRCLHFVHKRCKKTKCSVCYVGIKRSLSYQCK